MRRLLSLRQHSCIGLSAASNIGHVQRALLTRDVVVQVRAHAPEVLVVMQCGVSPQGVLACVTELAALPGWWGLPAVKNGCVYIVDHAPFLRPGPRVVRNLMCLLLKL